MNLMADDMSLVSRRKNVARRWTYGVELAIRYAQYGVRRLFSSIAVQSVFQ